jgi:hypothetical protein
MNGLDSEVRNRMYWIPVLVIVLDFLTRVYSCHDG